MNAARSTFTRSLRFLMDRDWFVRNVESGGAMESGEGLLGRSIFDVISDPSLRELLRVIFEKVYKLDRIVYLNYRCDTPDLRRYCVMRIERVHQGDGNWVLVENRTLVAQPRSLVRLLDETLMRSDERVLMCSWCKTIQVTEAEWCEVEEAVERIGLMKCERLPKLNHGMCPKCVSYLTQEARAMERQLEAVRHPGTS